MARYLDFEACKKKALMMTMEELDGAISDIHKTLDVADANDRANGTSWEGGYYRDEASVYHAERRARLRGRVG